MARVFVIILVLLCVGAGIFAFFTYRDKQKEASITSFEQCAKYYPIMESYPAQCSTPSGKHFTQNIGNELEYVNEILIENPRPNQSIQSPLKIIGKARGNWFFEASFPAELADANGKKIASGVMTAEGEWMTDDFVPFSGELSFIKPETKTGILKLQNDNPSGLPENQKTLNIPVTFK